MLRLHRRPTFTAPIWFGLFALLFLGPPAFSQSPPTSVLTQHNDNQRTGANLNETILTPANVNTGTFGKLFSCPVDGYIFAQPLYVPNVAIAGGTHNVLYVATAHDSVYAFDADTGAQLLTTSLGTAVPSSVIKTTNILVEVGIISTPVIDASTGTLYVVAKTYANSVQQFWLHALDITTLQDKLPPVQIVAQVSGTGYGAGQTGDNDGQHVFFVAAKENQRPSLTLVNGVLYLAFASHEDKDDYHGWVLAYDSPTLTQIAAYNTTPNGKRGGIWMSGQGLVADALNNVYLITGNSTTTSENSSGDLGEAFVKLGLSGGSLSVLDYFKAGNYDNLNAHDTDIGSGGAVGIPGTTDLVGGGKQGRFYLINTTNMGQLNTSADQVVQEWQADNGLWGAPIFWNGAAPTLYVWGANDHLKAYAFSNGLFTTTPASVSGVAAPSGQGGGSLSVTSNGGAPGTGILWATLPTKDPNSATVPGVLYAFDATNVAHELWDSTQSTGDGIGALAKFVSPTVVNGKVYVATDSEQVCVYGLLPPMLPAAPTGLSATPGNALALLNWTPAPHATDYNIKRAPQAGGPYTTVATGITTSSYVDRGLTNGTTYYYVVSSHNMFGESMANSNEAAATPSNTLPLFQINAGGGAVATFAADALFTGGATNSTGAAINVSAANAAPAAVYQTGRYASAGPFSYAFPGLSPGASYLLRLHFAETYWNQAGKRIENVTVNGMPALTKFDIFAAAGAENKAVVETLPVTADGSGTITVSIAAAAGSADVHALVAGFEVLPVALTPPTVATAASATPSPVTGTTTGLSVLGADAGGEPSLTYTWSATGPAAVAYSANGTNAAKNSVATFTQAGAYALTVTVQNGAGLTTTSSAAVTVSQTPTAIAVAPATATVAIGQTQPFTATATDQFGNALDTQPAFAWAATGAGTVSTAGLFTGVTAGPASVTAASGAVTSPAAAVTVTAPQPTITGLSPSSAVAGSGDFTLTVNGTNFLPSSTLTFGGAAPAVTGQTATTLTATVPAAAIAAAGPVTVTVTNPAPGGGSATATFTVVAPNPAPTITGLSPTSAVAGSAGFMLTVTGTNFLPTSTVAFGGDTGLTPTLVSATQLTVAVPAADIAAAGPVTVTVTNPAPGGGSATATFTVSPMATATALASSLNPSLAGQSVTFTATVTGSSPTGTVQFTVDGANAGAPVALSGGQASYTTSGLAAGSHSVTASYGGDGANAASASDTLTQAVNPTAPVPVDVSGQVYVQRAGTVYHSATHLYTQPVRLTDTGKSPIVGPVYLVVDGLGNASVLANRSGVTSGTAPAGRPYLLVSPKGLTPGVGMIVTLTFSARPTYTTRVLAGPGVP